MAQVEKFVPARTDDVWAVLADARSYAFWVVGSHDITGVHGRWPEVGSTFDHVQGHGPVKLSDTTTVKAVDPGRRLLLEVRIRPFLVGPVDLHLRPVPDGTIISIEEHVTGGLARALPRFVTSPLIAMRNADALRRLAAMAWTRAVTREPEAVPQPS
jgi:hypothetical protein